MTETEHLDEPALVAIATHGSPTAELAGHLEHCAVCGRELEIWRRISTVVRGSLASVQAEHDLADRILSQLETTLEEAPTPEKRLPAVGNRVRSRRPEWLVASIGVVTAAVVAIVLTLGPSTPSQAVVLKRIRSTPALAALWKTMHVSGSTTLRAPQGYVASSYRSKGEFSPITNAFTFTTSLVNPGGLRPSATYLSDGSLVYLPCDPAFRQIGERPCIAYPAEHGNWADTSLAFLRNVRGPAISLGQRSIGGVSTTGYRLTVPVNAYAAGAIPSERALIRSGLATTNTIRVEVWIDDRGLAREVDTTYLEKQANLPTLLRVTNKQEISYSREPLKVVVPHRDDVVVAPNLDAATQQFNAYAQEVGALHTNLSP